MKRLVTLLLALCMIFALAACGGTKCDICGETKSCKSIEVLGEKVNICSDCESDLTDLAGMIGG